MLDFNSTVLTILIGGGITIGIQYIVQRSTQKRQLFLDIAKHKFETIQKSSKQYVSMSSALGRYHALGSKGEEGNEERFYAMCKFFLGYSKISSIELENLEGESVIEHLCNNIFNIFAVLEDEAISDMIGLVKPKNDENPVLFNAFKKKIPPRLFKEFCDKIVSQVPSNRRLTDYSMWLREILLFEINMAYEIWYGEKPRFELDGKLKQYLQDNNFTPYVKRLESSNKPKLRDYCKARWIKSKLEV